MIIPYEQLSPDVLEAVIEEFITRDSTVDTALEVKVQQVIAQLQKGQIVLVYDEESQSCNLLPAREAAQAGHILSEHSQ